MDIFYKDKIKTWILWLYNFIVDIDERIYIPKTKYINKNYNTISNNRYNIINSNITNSNITNSNKIIFNPSNKIKLIENQQNIFKDDINPFLKTSSIININ